MENLLTVEEARKALNLKSIHTVYRWIEKGVLPVVRFGRSIRISSDDLQDYIANRKTKNARYMFKSGRSSRSPSFPIMRERRPEWIV